MVLINPVTYRRSLDVVATTVIEDFGLDRNDQIQFDNDINRNPLQVDDGQNGLIMVNHVDSTFEKVVISECEVGQYLQNGQCLSCQEISIAQAGFCIDNTVLSCTSPTQLVRCRECIQGYLPNNFNFCESTINRTGTSTTATTTTATTTTATSTSTATTTLTATTTSTATTTLTATTTPTTTATTTPTPTTTSILTTTSTPTTTSTAITTNTITTTMAATTTSTAITTTTTTTTMAATTTTTAITTTTTPATMSCRSPNAQIDHVCRNNMTLQYVYNIDVCLFLCNDILGGRTGCCQFEDYRNNLGLCGYGIGFVNTAVSPSGSDLYAIDCSLTN